MCVCFRFFVGDLLARVMQRFKESMPPVRRRPRDVAQHPRRRRRRRRRQITLLINGRFRSARFSHVIRVCLPPRLAADKGEGTRRRGTMGRRCSAGAAGTWGTRSATGKTAAAVACLTSARSRKSERRSGWRRKKSEFPWTRDGGPSRSCCGGVTGSTGRSFFVRRVEVQRETFTPVPRKSGATVRHAGQGGRWKVSWVRRGDVHCPYFLKPQRLLRYGNERTRRCARSSGCGFDTVRDFEKFLRFLPKPSSSEPRLKMYPLVNKLRIFYRPSLVKVDNASQPKGVLDTFKKCFSLQEFVTNDSRDRGSE